MKKILFILLGILTFIVLCFWGYNGVKINQQELIKEYVKENKIVLLELVNEIKSSTDIDENAIIKNMPKNIKICGVYKSEQNNYIDFSVDEGFTSSSHYYGFYYSPENEVKFIMGVPGEIYEFENGYKKCEQGNEDWYYTEKIVDNFYFYEAHY